MKNNRASEMMKNIGLFFIASFGTKFLSFFLVPFYTSLVSTQDYGTADYLNTIIGLILPVLMLDISDAVMFFSFREDSLAGKQQPLLYADRILSASSLLLGVALAIIAVATGGKDMPIYCLYILVYYFLQAFYLNILAYMRSINEVKTITISSLITSVVMLTLNIVLIVCLRMGLYALLISSVVGHLASTLYCAMKVRYFSFFRTPMTLTKEQRKQMLSYSIPLIFSGLAWWVNSSLDKFFVTYFCGIGTNGIYAMANKIPTLLNAVHSVIYQAMQLSIFTELKAKDSKTYMKRLYSIYNFVMVMACSVLIILDKLLAKYLFKGEYYVAWQYVPIMLLSAVMFSVSGYVTIIAVATKDTKTIAAATVSGAAVNALLNFLLIPRIELFGAVISTALGYFVIWLILVLKAEKLLQLRFPKFRSIVMYAVLAAQWVVLLLGWQVWVWQLILFAILIVLNLPTFIDLLEIALRLLKKILSKMKRKK